MSGLAGGIEAEDDADGGREAEGDEDRFHLDLCAPLGEVADRTRSPEPHGDTDDAARSDLEDDPAIALGPERGDLRVGARREQVSARALQAASRPGLDDYQLRHETTFRNLSDAPLALPRAVFNLGTAAPLSDTDTGIYLNVGYYNGDSTEFVRRDQLASSGFMSSAPPPAFLDQQMHDLHLERFVNEPGDGPMKTFTLRGIKDSPPYLHDGRLLTLEDTVEFFNIVLQLKLSTEEKRDLVAYMRQL